MKVEEEGEEAKRRSRNMNLGRRWRGGSCCEGVKEKELDGEETKRS